MNNHNEAYRGHIAIDLGTTNSVVSYIQPDGSIRLVPNLDGEFLTPSFIWFDKDAGQKDKNTLIGKKAKEQMHIDPTNVLSCYKPHMGTGKIIKKLSLFNQPTAAFKAETCSKLVLRYLKKSAETELGETTNSIVVTVPARFTDPQRNATQLCCSAIGLDVLKIISEPTAAAYHYGVNSQCNGDIRTILAIDLGGGTFDASVIINNGTDTSVAGTEGDIHLGGDDIDQALAATIASMALPKGVNYSDITENAREIFVRKAEEAKIALCNKYAEENDDYKKNLQRERAITFTVDLSVIEDFGVELIKTQVKVDYVAFRKAATPLIKRAMDITRQLLTSLEDDGVSSLSDITDILLVGGSSRIPLIREMLIALILELGVGEEPGRFNPEYFRKYLTDPDLSVSLGAAAYMKAILDGDEYKITDIVPMPIGIEVVDDVTGEQRMEVVINKGSMLPTRILHNKPFTNVTVGKSFAIKVFEGVSSNPNDNSLLGTVDIPLNEEQQAKPKSAQVKVTIGVSKDGIVELSYTDVVNARKGKLLLNRHTDLADNTGLDDGLDTAKEGPSALEF